MLFIYAPPLPRSKITSYPHGIFAAGGAFVPTQGKKKKGLKSPVITDSGMFRSLTLDKSKLRPVQNSSNSSLVWLANLYKHEKNNFFLPIMIFVTRQSLKVHKSSLFIIGKNYLQYIQTSPLFLLLR